ncbi:hypothetical protein tb265_45050 [Gemmatimonadetes bacterium T265]|nr:hypothetical protein tb265_45050 [Gemmatimonadetes bacterium T265]
MTDRDTIGEPHATAHDAVSRRALLTRAAATGLGVAALGWMGTAQAAGAQPQPGARAPQQPEADSGHDYAMPTPNARTERDFRTLLIGPAMLSLAASQLAVTTATDPQAKEFANFELREAIAVTTVLRELQTPVPPMDAMARATLEKIQTAARGAAFDQAYITAQRDNHEFLRDLAEGYLRNSAGATSMPELHGRHLATLALATFKEHVVHTKTILRTLSA